MKEEAENRETKLQSHYVIVAGLVLGVLALCRCGLKFLMFTRQLFSPGISVTPLSTLRRKSPRTGVIAEEQTSYSSMQCGRSLKGPHMVSCSRMLKYLCLSNVVSKSQPFCAPPFSLMPRYIFSKLHLLTF